MQLRLVIVWLLIFPALSFGQTAVAPPSPVPTISTEKSTPRNFGSSLKRFDDKKTKTSENNNNSQTDEAPIRVETNLVVNSVLVISEKGNAVKGLTRDDFIISEDGRPQEVGVFSFGDNDVPRSIVLIMDYSGSQSPFIETSVAAAKILVDKLRPQDRLAIVTDDVKLLADFTKDKELLKKKLESLKDKAREDPDAKFGWYRGHSLPYSALLVTLQELFDRTDKAPIVIFQTDGDELDVLKPIDRKFRQAKSVERNFTLPDIYETVEKSNAAIYGIIPGIRLLGLPKQIQLEREKSLLKNLLSDRLGKAFGSTKMADNILNSQIEMGIERTVRQQETLAKIVRLSGGYTNFLENPADAEGIYTDILTVINNRYTIGYYPTDQARDGQPRQIKIEVRNHPEFKILGRTAYLAPPPATGN